MSWLSKNIECKWSRKLAEQTKNKVLGIGIFDRQIQAHVWRSKRTH
jgi:Uri superfamily endonuclease